MQDCKDGSGLQFIKFDFVTAVKKSKLPFFYFVSSVNISLLLSLLAIFSSYLKIIKQA